tara:strand:+ start:2907 stop:4073 length:1167 start_codon:yes stop_codon:yes gene_type:complete
MGFFSKIFKGVKKVFKKIGKGIKKVATKVGKFMNKIGIVGQIAMAFILPGVGAALANTLGNVGAWATAALANPATSALVKGVAHVVNGAAKFAAGAGRVFNTVTSAVKNYVGEVGKTMLNKIPGINIESAATNVFGKGGALDIAAQATGETWNTTIGSGEWWKKFARTPEMNQVSGFTSLKPGETGFEPKFSDPSSPDFVREGAYADDFSSLIPDPKVSAGSSPADLTRQGLEMRQPPAGDYTTMDVVGKRVDPTTGFEVELPSGVDLDIPEVRFDKPSLLDRVKGESGVSYSDEVIEGVTSDYKGLQIKEKSLAAAGTEAIKEVGKSLMAPEPEEALPYGGSVVVVQNAYDVTGSQISQLPQVGYGLPMVQYDGLYKPKSTWARMMG